MISPSPRGNCSTPRLPPHQGPGIVATSLVGFLMNPSIRGQLFPASTAPLPHAEADFDAGLQTLREVRLGCTVGRWASLKQHFTNLELQTDISALID